MESSSKKLKLSSQVITGQPADPGGTGEPVEMPPLVFRVFVNTIQDIALIKRCRLVCKGWNAEACAILRVRSFVLLEECKFKRVEEFRDQLLSKAVGSLASLPTPFNNFHVVATSLSNKGFTTFINLPAIKITNLAIRLIPLQPNLERLKSLIESKKAGLAEVSINDVSKAHTSSMRLSPQNMMTLKVKDSCSEATCFHSRLMNAFLRGSTLTAMELDVEDNKLQSTLEQEKLKALLKLDLDLGVIETSTWNYLASCHLPVLTKLTMYGVLDNTKMHLKQLSALITTVSPTIQILMVEAIRISELPILPKLEHICVLNWDDDLRLFTPEAFPSLRDVQLTISDPDVLRKLQIIESPHCGIQFLTIRVPRSSEMLSSARKHFYLFLGYLNSQFPSATDLAVEPPAWDACIFVDIHKSFPNIAAIQIDGSCDFESISGTEMSIVNEYLEKGWEMGDNFFRKTGIFDFQELRSLALGSEVKVTNEMITYCFSKLEKLETLKFYWNENLSVEEVRDCLKHLDEVNILNGTDEKFQGPISQLRTWLSNVVS